MSAGASRLRRLLAARRPVLVYLYPRGAREEALEEIAANLPGGASLARCHLATEVLLAASPAALCADDYAERGLVGWVNALLGPLSRRAHPLVLLLEAGGAGEAALREHAELLRFVRRGIYHPARLRGLDMISPVLCPSGQGSGF